MLYQNKYQKKAHREVEMIFRSLLPENGLNVREEQVRLCHQMLDTLFSENISLFDAGVGIGKTYAYLTACVMQRKYGTLLGRLSRCDSRPVVVSTSSIALQKAMLEEYIPFLSKVFMENGIIQSPLQAIVRKGKEHFVCDCRLEQRLEAVSNKEKNKEQKSALLSLRCQYDMDRVHGLSGFDRRLVCVPKFCPKDCPGRTECRYQNYLKQAKSPEIFIQICNHNYLLADASHRSKGFRPLLSDYRALIVDEAHQLPEAARQMYGKTLGNADVNEICRFLEKEHQTKAAGQLKEIFRNLLDAVECCFSEEMSGKAAWELSGECSKRFQTGIIQIAQTRTRLRGAVPSWTLNRLEEAEDILRCFYRQDKNYILYLLQDKERLPVLCATSRKVPELLQKSLWRTGIPAILTSGTLKAGTGFERTKQVTGLGQIKNVREYVAKSPFEYEKNCLLYLPKSLKKYKRGSREETAILAMHIQSLICATHGHTLVLFTSYSLMGSVYQLLKDVLPFSMVEVWRHSQEEIARFKTMDNAVLFAAGSCWEGVDFPGDMVSSLIIVKLPFAVPNPVSEAEKEEHASLEGYIQSTIIPDMQKKLRQGFGRAIRTEQDTCVVSILDYRAAAGGKYHSDVLCALPDCKRADSIEDVETFIRSRKGTEYFM